MMYLFCETNKPAGSRKRDILEFLVQFNEWMKKKNTDFSPYNSFLIVFGEKAYWITPDLMIQEIKDYCAIGSGMEYAKAGLHLGKSVKDSIKIACELTIYCSEPIEIFEVKLKEAKWKYMS